MRFRRPSPTPSPAHPRIRVSREEICRVPGHEWSPVIIATGPLTSDALSKDIQAMVGEEHLAFYDAISPIVLAESIDMSKVFRASRWGRSLRAPNPSNPSNLSNLSNLKAIT